MIIFLQKIYQHDFFSPIRRLLRGMQIFHKNHGMTVSAGATFYAILSFMPLMLFSVTIIQKFFGTYFQFKATLFSYLSEFFPSTSNWVTQMVEQALKHQEGAKAGSSWLGLFILAWGSLSFLNAMFQGIEIISGKDLHRGILIRFKSLFIMLVTIISIVLMMAITPLSLFITKWLQNTALVQFLLKLTAFVPYLGSFLQKVDLSQSVAYWSNSKLFFAILMVIYFTFLFRYLFNKNIGYKDSFWGGLFFVLLFNLGKYLFWFYLFYLRDGLMRHYGAFYTLMATLFWVYFLMLSFFFSASLCYASEERSLT